MRSGGNSPRARRIRRLAGRQRRSGDGALLHGLRQLALSETVDMLVLGSTRRGRLGRLLHPSVARGVLRDPPCAVTVVSHDPRDRARSAPGQPESSDHGRQSASGTVTPFHPGAPERGDLIHGHPPQAPA
ncbi:MAG: universal stress protein [Solirubrobacteraceae bacterium]